MTGIQLEKGTFGDFTERPEKFWIFALGQQFLHESVVYSSLVVVACHYSVTEAAFCNLVEYLPLVLDSVTSQLPHRALAD